MKLSVLHISDLHRHPDHPISNDVLLDSLENDRRRYSDEETPSVRSPNLIIVSGDIIYGISADTLDPDGALLEQYNEAYDFLAKLTDRYVKGDRSRVIVVPGNHDVSAYHFEKSLRRVDILPDRKKELVTQLFLPGSRLRWSWPSFDLYEIADQALYEQRLSAFSEFYAKFYDGTRIYELDPSKQLDIFDFPAFDSVVAGFSSCYNNDLYNRQGAIHPECIANTGTKLRDRSYQNRLRIAVWHHNSEGLPLHSDYLDPDLIQNLIDRGFSLGFHGHQHRPQFLDTRFHHGKNRRIVIISAGTLCGGASYRFGRSYNVIELDTDSCSGCLHVREMQNDNLSLPIWGPRALPPTTHPFSDFQYDPPPKTTSISSTYTAELVEAQRFYDRAEFQKAADVLIPLKASEELARPLLLDCLIKLKDLSALITHFDPPASEAEAIHVMDALWSEGKHDRLRQLLNFSMLSDSTDLSVIEMRNKYLLRLKK